MFNAEVIKVIRTTLEHKGKGVAGDPVRIITQYWTLDGELLAEVDQWAAENTTETNAKTEIIERTHDLKAEEKTDAQS